MSPDYKINGKWAASQKILGERYQTTSYSVWQNMLRRVRGGDDNPTYKGCTVTPTFKDFQRFAEWYTTQIGYGQGYHLDKDLLVPGNKVYGEEFCVLIPKPLNNFLCGMGARRGLYKQGVSLHPVNRTFVAHISSSGVSTYLGSFLTEDAAFAAYKVAKRNDALVWANKLKHAIIDPRVIEALKDYDVERYE